MEVARRVRPSGVGRGRVVAFVEGRSLGRLDSTPTASVTNSHFGTGGAAHEPLNMEDNRRRASPLRQTLDR